MAKNPSKKNNKKLIKLLEKFVIFFGVLAILIKLCKLFHHDERTDS